MMNDPQSAERVRRMLERQEKEREEEGRGGDVGQEGQGERYVPQEPDPEAKRRRMTRDAVDEEGMNEALHGEGAAGDEHQRGSHQGSSNSSSSSSRSSSSSSSSSGSSNQGAPLPEPQGQARGRDPEEEEGHDTSKRQRLEEVNDDNMPKVAEIYSPPRVSTMAEQMGMRAGSSMDLRTGWNFNLRSHRQACRKKLADEKPDLVIRSPECRMFFNTSEHQSE